MQKKKKKKKWNWSYLSLFFSRRLIWWAYRIGRHLSSVVRRRRRHRRPHSLNISSETLGQSKSNFIWSYYGMGEQKFVHMFLVTWPRWLPCPYMVKNLKNLLWNQKANDLETWYARLGARVLPSLLKWLPWVDLDLILRQGQIWSFMLLLEKGKTMDFSETIVVYDVKVGRCS